METKKVVRRKSLEYYMIQYGGVPLTPDGLVRFVKSAIFYGGYSADEIKAFLKVK